MHILHAPRITGSQPSMLSTIRLVGVLLAVTLAAFVLTACFHEPDEENLSLIKRQLKDYVKTGKYDNDIAAVVGEAKDFLQAHASASVNESKGKVAIVLDIDDTALSSIPSLLANDFGLIKDGACLIPKGPCGWGSWQELGKAPAIAPTLALSQLAKKLGFAVFFITGRQEKYREATERNLRSVGYADWDGLILRGAGVHYPSEAEFKAPVREKLESQGYVLNSVGNEV